MEKARLSSPVSVTKRSSSLPAQKVQVGPHPTSLVVMSMPWVHPGAPTCSPDPHSKPPRWNRTQLNVQCIKETALNYLSFFLSFKSRSCDFHRASTSSSASVGQNGAWIAATCAHAAGAHYQIGRSFKLGMRESSLSHCGQPEGSMRQQGMVGSHLVTYSFTLLNLPPVSPVPGHCLPISCSS